jgi:hypothetical protein
MYILIKNISERWPLKNRFEHLVALRPECINGDPVWPPDGRQISFGSDREGNEKLNIFIMNADGSDIRKLTHCQTPIESGTPTGHLRGQKLFLKMI